ncbi:glycosyltransferase [bacterium]|nr:glycosyltransferase [bacterium]
MRLNDQNIVCFSTADWDTLLPTNKHQLMRRLARRNRVLFIETLGTRAPCMASGTDLARIGRRLRRTFEGPSRRGKQLWTLSPLVRPGWGSLTARAANQIAFQAQVRNVRKQFPVPIVWVYSPYAVYLLDQFKPKLVVYHMVDDLAAVPGADEHAIREAEARLLARADCVFCTERSLYDRAAAVNPAARFMPNVADYRHFARPREVDDERLAKLRQLDGPRLVFSGHLAPHKVDLRILEHLARERPDWQLILIGPVWEGADENATLQRLRKMSNVHFLGHVPYRDLPAYLHAADLLLIPYVRNRATRAVFPLKFFEYCATGRPIVASPLPSLLPYHEAVRLAGRPSTWVRACEESLRADGELAEQRQVLARRHTWNVRLAEMDKEIARAMDL